MKNNPNFRYARIGGLAVGSALLLTALAAYGEEASVVVHLTAPVAPVVELQAGVVQDDYVYYPQYEVYYSSSRHQYGYRDGNAWVWRPEPPHVGINVLLGSPSVRMDFHDSPERHHEAIVRSYPRNWSPPGKGHDDHRDDRKDDDHKH